MLDDNQTGSKWQGLNKHLLAKIYPIDIEGNRIKDTLEIIAPAIESTVVEATLNWHSAFESTGADSAKPMLTSMIQAGTIQPIMNMVTGATKDFVPTEGTKVLTQTEGYLDDLMGRTGMTKLNSRQTFVGMPPLKINTTLYFRAFSNPIQEVHKPLDTLWNYSLARAIADGGQAENLLSAVNAGGTTKDYLFAMMPSISPFLLSFQYKKRKFAPVVIESISEPMESPITSEGHYTQMQVTLSLATLSALSAEDWKKNIALSGI